MTNPVFSAKQLDPPEEKLIANKTSTRRKRKVVSELESEDIVTVKKRSEIDENLALIYKDKNGEFPDMKRIKIKKRHPIVNFFVSLLFIGSLLAAVAWVGFIYLPIGGKNDDEKITLSINGPTEAVFGATSTYVISFANMQTSQLKNLTLTVQYPKGFVISTSSPAADNEGQTEWQLTDLASGKKNSVSISGSVYGSLNQEQSWRVFLSYKQEGTNLQTQKVAIYNFKVANSPITLTASGPSFASAGNKITYNWRINNTESWQPDQLELTPTLPLNFVIASSSPALGKNNSWILNPDKKTTSTAWTNGLNFSLSGSFTSSSLETSSTIKTELNFYNKKTGQSYQVAVNSIVTELTSADALELNLAINGASEKSFIKPGDNLDITISLNNPTPKDLSNATVKLTLDTPSIDNKSLLNWPEINDKYDGDIQGKQVSSTIRRGEITWNKRHISQLTKLKPGDNVIINVSIPIKTEQKLSLSDLSEFKITASAGASYIDALGNTQNVASKTNEIITNSDLMLEVRDKISTDNTYQEIHDLTWVLTNSFHPLKNIVLSANIYGDAVWSQETSAPAGTVDFDQTSKTLTWKIDDMPESVDVLALPFTVSLKQKNPTQSMLVSKVKVEAEDTVTGEKISLMGEEIRLK